MYGALIRLIPGPRWVKITTISILGAAAVAALMLFVFPLVDNWFNNPTIGN